MKYNSGLVHARTKFELNNSKFAQVRKSKANFQEIQNLKHLDASIDFSQIQDQRFLLDILYLCAILGQ